MGKIIQTIGIIGFFITLSIMYMSKLGVRGIREFDPLFQSPDMKFHYSALQITEIFDKIGDTGRIIYQKYLYLDCAFTIFFLIVMIVITNLLFTGITIRSSMFAVCILRAVFDILENIFLLLALKKYPVINAPMMTLCSYFTTIKFVLLYIWIFALITQIVSVRIAKIQRH